MKSADAAYQCPLWVQKRTLGDLRAMSALPSSNSRHPRACARWRGVALLRAAERQSLRGRCWMNVVNPLYLFRVRFDIRQVEIDDHRLLAAAHQHARQRLVVVRIDFLVRDKWRDVNEVTGASFRHELEPVTPTHASA